VGTGSVDQVADDGQGGGQVEVELDDGLALVGAPAQLAEAVDPRVGPLDRPRPAWIGAGRPGDLPQLGRGHRLGAHVLDHDAIGNPATVAPPRVGRGELGGSSPALPRAHQDSTPGGTCSANAVGGGCSSGTLRDGEDHDTRTHNLCTPTYRNTQPRAA